MEPRKYTVLADHYEACLDRFGDTYMGVDWPNQEDAERRYDVMLGLTAPFGLHPGSLLDVGCGAGHLLTYMSAGTWDHLSYRGLDISPKFIDLCQSKFPGVAFDCVDLLADESYAVEADFAVMNGVFTEKLGLSHEEMVDFTTRMLRRTFACVRKGLAFNVMSTIVDWQRDDLFHWSFDEAANVIAKNLSRNFVVRHDYRLYEYTFYVYR